MRKPMCHTRRCKPNSRQTFAQSSMHLTGPLQTPTLLGPLRNTSRVLRDYPSGWRPTSPKVSPSLPFQPAFDDCCAPPTAWSDCIGKSAAEHVSFRSFPIPLPACDLYPQYSLKLAKNG